MSKIEFNDATFTEITNLLKNTLSPDPEIRRPSEKALVEQLETRENYGPVLLLLCNKNDLDMHLRMVASVSFKNYIKRNWRVSEEEDLVNKICDNDRMQIKASIIELMLTNPEQIQRQLSDAISIISREDFPDKWQNLLDGMIERLKSGDFHIINGVLRTAHSIFRRYRHEFKSTELWREIKYVLGLFAQPMTELFQTLMGLIEKHAQDKAALNLIFSSIILICKIFRSLNAQDLAEEFENNMEIYMSNFLSLLMYENGLLVGDDETAGPLEQVKSQICDNISLFAQNYGEEFQDYLPKFVTAVWNLLISIGLDTKYDVLVSNAIQFLTAVVLRPQYKALFDNEESLKSICEKVIIPNLFLRDCDIETFEDNPEEYLRKDIERSDTDTRRRSASELVQALCIHFEKQVVAIFSSYVQVLLEQYAQDPAKNWRQKDAVLFLVTTLASRGQTKKHGTTKASELIDITQFYTATVLPDLNESDVNSFPVLKADSMRYIATFRQQLSKDILVTAITNLIRFLTSKEPVVHTYACHAIEKILTVKSTTTKDNLITYQDISNVSPTMIGNILNILQPVQSENEYAMRTLMRLCFLMQDNIEPYVEAIMSKLIVLLESISKNPSKPNFNHYLFETFGVIIRGVCAKNPSFVAKFEANLFPIFNIILQNDITEFIPYAFQLLSLMLELNSDKVIPEPYHQLFPFILMPVLWERPGYVPALARLLQAYIERGGETIIAEKITACLGIFQRLVASKMNDQYAFSILKSLIQHLPESVLSTYIKQIFFLLFQRLTSSKTTKFVKNMLVFLSLYAWKYGGNNLVDLIEGIQGGMFIMVLEKLYAPDLQKVTGIIDRKICAVGLVKMLTECSVLLNNETNLKIWVLTLDALVGLFELPEDTAATGSEEQQDHFVDSSEDLGYQASFNQLLSANKKEQDPFNGEITNTKYYLAKKLEGLSSQMPGKIGKLVGQMDPKSQEYLHKYTTEAQVAIH